MAERIARLHAGEPSGRPAPEGSPGGRKHDPLDRPFRVPLEALQDARVLGIDRDQLARTADRAGKKLPARHQRLLVRERQTLARLERPERRLESRETDDGIDDDVHVGAARRLDKPAPVRRPAPRDTAPPGTRPPARYHHVRRGVPLGLPGERIDGAMRRQDRHLEALGVALDHA